MPCSASPSLVVPGGMPGAPDWPATLMIVTVPSPPAISQDGEMASQGAHCCESARSPPIGRIGLTCPRVTVVSERLITSTPSWSSRPCCTEHAPAGLGDHGPGEPGDALGRGSRRWGPRPGPRARRRGEAGPADGAALPAVIPGGRLVPRKPAGSRARTQRTARRSARQHQGPPRRATAASQGREATGGAGPIQGPAAARRRALTMSSSSSCRVRACPTPPR